MDFETGVYGWEGIAWKARDYMIAIVRGIKNTIITLVG
jgi:hypothetical protein